MKNRIVGVAVGVLAAGALALVLSSPRAAPTTPGGAGIIGGTLSQSGAAASTPEGNRMIARLITMTSRRMTASNGTTLLGDPTLVIREPRTSASNWHIYQ